MNQKKPKTYNLPAYINIPLFLYQDESLDRTALLLAAFIYSLYTAGNIINVKNDYLSKMLKIHERKVQSNLEVLEQKGYLIRIGLGSNREIKWIFSPESKITVQEMNDPADNGTLPTTAPQPCRQRHPYNKDNKDNIYISEHKTLKPVEYQDTYYNVQPIEEHLNSKKEAERTFQEFWCLYPKKKNENRAKSIWFSQSCYLIHEQIISKLKQQVAKDKQFLTGYAPNPDNYLLNERWKDEIEEEKKKTNKKTNHSASVITDWDINLHNDII